MSNNELPGHSITFQLFHIEYLEKLVAYFNVLSPETKSRFAPHPFHKEGIQDLFQDPSYRLYIALENEKDTIIAYTIVKLGWTDYDTPRLQSYKLVLDDEYCTIAPSVADNWQSRGLGSRFFRFVLDQLKYIEHRQKIVLWGGVQAANLKAVRFYKKHDFIVLGEFEHHGNNFDMLKTIPSTGSEIL